MSTKALLTVKASAVAKVHTYLAFVAFLTALGLGSLLHFKKIVKNSVAGYPEEWFPSVSATIGDWYPERSIFHILIALNSGPRFALVFLQYYLSRSPTAILPLVVLISGLIRTVSCGGWVYITSSDDHDAHDFLMITYILCNIPWMVGNISCTNSPRAKRRRIIFSSTFFASIIPLVYFFLQHKVYSVPGAYTRYAFFEWNLIFTDVLFDSVNELDFAEANLEITVGVPTGSKEATWVPNRNATNVNGSELGLIITSLETPTGTSHSFEKVLNPDHNGVSIPEESVAQSHVEGQSGIYARFARLAVEQRPIISYVSDIYLNYLFWSIYTSLAPTLFYFSVWELGIAGAELSLVAILSPIFLEIGTFKNWAISRGGRTTLHCVSLLGLIAYLLPKPFHRLLLVTIANAFLCIGAAIDWSNTSDGNSSLQSILIGVGLLLSSVSKIANHGNNPIWPMVNEASGGYNKSGILLAFAVLYEYYTRPPTHSVAPEKSQDKALDIISGTDSIVFCAIPLGGLIFSLHCFLTDPSTLIAWSWTGYPVKGPIPHVHGALTIMLQAVGLLIPLILPQTLLRHPLWFSVGATSAFVMHSSKNWQGYFGGLGFAVFLMSIIPQIMQQASCSRNTGKTYFTAFLTVILLYLANVWTVAYAFVPGGKYLRERSDLVLMAQLLLLAPAFQLPAGLFTNSSRVFEPSRRLKSLTCSSVAFACMGALIASLYRMPSHAPRPFKEGPRIIRAGIWTMHFGMDNGGRDSQRGMMNLIQDMQLDIVGLLETDLHRIVFGNRDLTRVLVEEMGYYVDVGPGPNQHTWGAVLLSMFPIINSTHHLLPSPHGELAPAISAWLDVWGTQVFVVVAHNGQEEDPLDRELQATELARIMSSVHPHPTIFLGYVVTHPHAQRPAPYEIMVNDGRVHDIDADDYDRWCEYIFYRGLYRTSYLRMSRGKITDTELQVGQFLVPRYGHSVTDDSKEARYLRRNKERLADDHWFPMEYYGNENEGGVNRHYYHVFGTPLYYDIPDSAVL